MATSASMLLMYHYNNGEMRVLQDLTNVTQLRNKLINEYIGSSQVSPREYVTGVTRWLREAGYTNINIYYRTADMNDGQNLYDDEIEDVIDSIMDDKPIITMVGQESYSINVAQDIIHAMVTYGVKYDASEDEYYVVSKDPNPSKTPNNNGERIEESLWSTWNDNTRPEFGIYAVIYTSFS